MAKINKQQKARQIIVLLVAFAVIGTFIICGSGGKHNPKEQDENKRATDSTKSTDNNIKTENANTIQADFVNKKTEEFKREINSGATANEIKQKQKSLTTAFLKEQKNKLIDWSGKIIWVDMYQKKECDIAITIKESTIVGQKTITKNGQDWTMNRSITIEADQGESNKGIVRSGDLYEKIKNLKEGDNVIFSAEVVGASDYTEKTGLNLGTLLTLKITDIRKQ